MAVARDSVHGNGLSPRISSLPPTFLPLIRLIVPIVGWCWRFVPVQPIIQPATYLIPGKGKLKMRQILLKWSRAGGFTVIELLVVVAIAAIFIALGVPSFTDFIRQTRLSSAMNDLSADLFLARSEAIKRNSRVLVCARATATATTCSTTPAAGTWMNGWLVCFDADSNGVCDATSAADPNPIKTHAALVSPLLLSGPAAAVIFLPVGSAFTTATFTMTGSTTVTRTATVALSGSVTVTKS